MISPALAGCRVLLIEDEFFQAREAQRLLEKAGADVIGPVARAEDLCALLDTEAIDIAMIDINLGFGADFSSARALQDREIPFLFLTGYDAASIPADFAQAPRLEKPAREIHVIEGLARLAHEAGR